LDDILAPVAQARQATCSTANGPRRALTW